MNVVLDVNTLSEYRTLVAAVSQEKQWKLVQAIVPICCFFFVFPVYRNVNKALECFRTSEDTHFDILVMERSTVT